MKKLVLLAALAAGAAYAVSNKDKIAKLKEKACNGGCDYDSDDADDDADEE